MVIKQNCLVRPHTAIPNGSLFVNVKQVIENAKLLNAKEKAMIAHCLISSLETRQDCDVDKAWGELSQKRFDELILGEVEPVSWEAIKKKVKE